MKNPSSVDQSRLPRISSVSLQRRYFVPLVKLMRQSDLQSIRLTNACIDNESAGHSCRKLFIVDWDDTLNASSWCVQRGIMLIRLPNEDEKMHLGRLSVRCADTLQGLMKLGHVIIVTNAEEGWVQSSARTLMPEVSKYVYKYLISSQPRRLLSMIPVISARTNFESVCYDSPVSWKVMTFARAISEWADCNTDTSSDSFHVISIGDSSHEREAVFRVQKHHRIKFIPKSVKFPERLSIDELVSQHDHLFRHIVAVTHDEKPLDVMIDINGELDTIELALPTPAIALKNLQLPYMRPQSMDSSTHRSFRRTSFPRRRPRSRVPEFFPQNRVSLLVRASSSPRI